MNERIVCLDIGDVRIGVAVSDPSGTIASPVEVIRRIGWGPDVQKIKAICDRYGTNRILSGLPLNMDGTEGFQARKVRDFCAQLEKAGLKVSGINPERNLVEMVELPDHPYFIACQFHPEFKSRPQKAHPLFDGLIGAAWKGKENAQKN